MESLQEKLSRVRKPRVHITYEVETEGAMVERSLPFVVGVLGDFSGNAGAENKPLKERKFIQIDRDNFNEVMRHIGPALSLHVENTLQNDGSDLVCELKFNSMDDFEPKNIVDQVQPLKFLLETRNKLRDLSTKIDRSDDLASILESVLQNTEELQKFGADLGLNSANTNNPSSLKA